VSRIVVGVYGDWYDIPDASPPGIRLRLVTSQGPPYPSRSPRAHPSGWTRTQGLSRRDSHAPPLASLPRCAAGADLGFRRPASSPSSPPSEHPGRRRTSYEGRSRRPRLGRCVASPSKANLY